MEMKIRVKHNFTRSTPSWNAEHIARFGERNEGFLYESQTADTVRGTFDEWNAAQRPGDMLNPFYLTIAEEKK
jgi:hypothetical protein